MAECLSSYLCNVGIKNDIMGECDNPIFSGIEAVGIIINKADIDSIVRDASNPHVITAITMKTGTHAYKFVQERNNPFTGTNTQANVGDFRNDFTLTVSGFIPLDGAEPSKEILTPMANGKFVVIIQNQWLHTDSNNTVDNEFQVYGADRGLQISSMAQTRYENNDAWIIEMQETGVQRASTFFIDETDTCKAVTDLLTATEGE